MDKSFFLKQVWVDAGTQVFYSYGVGMSALTALGSFNEYKHDSYRLVLSIKKCP